MGAKDILVLTVVAVLVGLAVAYIIKEKKNGAKCIGCPNAKSCSKIKCK